MFNSSVSVYVYVIVYLCRFAHVTLTDHPDRNYFGRVPWRTWRADPSSTLNNTHRWVPRPERTVYRHHPIIPSPPSPSSRPILSNSPARPTRLFVFKSKAHGTRVHDVYMQYTACTIHERSGFANKSFWRHFYTPIILYSSATYGFQNPSEGRSNIVKIKVSKFDIKYWTMWSIVIRKRVCLHCWWKEIRFFWRLRSWNFNFNLIPDSRFSDSNFALIKRISDFKTLN